MIVDAGFLVQLDDARAAVTYDRMVPPATLQGLPRVACPALDVISMRRPRECRATDNPLSRVLGQLARTAHVRRAAQGHRRPHPAACAPAPIHRAANPRHEHEWRLWETVKLPAGSVLIPGVISHATNVVEHPELVAERIVRLARLVGRENVIAGTDCGFAQQTFFQRVHPSICGRSSKRWSRAPICKQRALAAEAGSRPARGPSSRGETTDREAGGQAAERAVAHRRAFPDRKRRNACRALSAMLEHFGVDRTVNAAANPRVACIALYRLARFHYFIGDFRRTWEHGRALSIWIAESGVLVKSVSGEAAVFRNQ